MTNSRLRLFLCLLTATLLFSAPRRAAADWEELDPGPSMTVSPTSITVQTNHMTTSTLSASMDPSQDPSGSLEHVIDGPYWDFSGWSIQYKTLSSGTYGAPPTGSNAPVLALAGPPANTASSVTLDMTFKVAGYYKVTVSAYGYYGDDDGNDYEGYTETHDILITAFSIDIGSGGTVVVGQKVTESATVLPSDLSPTYSWSIGGNNVKSYAWSHKPSGMATSSAHPVALTSGDKTSQSIGFYWIAGGTGIAVSCTVTAGGVNGTGNATFNVDRPVVNSFEGVVTVDDPTWTIGDGGWGLGNRLSFGTNADEHTGITFSASVKTTSSEAGQVAFVQLVSGGVHTIGDTTHDEVHQKRTTGGNYILDDDKREEGDSGVFYHVDDISASDDGHIMSDTDSPGSTISGLSSITDDSSFETYLMYKPAGTDSIWVTLSLLCWYCDGAANNPDGGGWNLETSEPETPDVFGSGDSTDFPQWDAYWSDTPVVAE